MGTKANGKLERFEAQQIGWMTDSARVHAARVAKEVTTDKAALDISTLMSKHTTVRSRRSSNALCIRRPPAVGRSTRKFPSSVLAGRDDRPSRPGRCRVRRGRAHGLPSS
jgi:hypothetical protein